MATRSENNSWNDQTSIRAKAKASVENFLKPVRGEKEEARPLSPELVARVTENKGPKGREVGADDISFDEEDNHEERMVRVTERASINQAPNTTYPG